MATRVPRRVHPVEVASVLGGSAALLGSWVLVVRDHGVPFWEADIFQAVNDLPGALWPLVWGPMQVGSFVGALGAVVVVFAVTRDGRLTLAALIGTQVAFWSAKGVKSAVNR